MKKELFLSTMIVCCVSFSTENDLRSLEENMPGESEAIARALPEYREAIREIKEPGSRDEAKDTLSRVGVITALSHNMGAVRLEFTNWQRRLIGRYMQLCIPYLGAR